MDEMSLSIISLEKRQAENKAAVSTDVDRAETTAFPQFRRTELKQPTVNLKERKNQEEKKKKSARGFLGVPGHFPRAVPRGFRSEGREWNEIPGSLQ